MQGWRGIAIATLLGLLPLAAVAQSCDLDGLATSLHDGRMPDLHGCPREVVGRALHAGEMRAAFTSGPSAVAPGSAYAQDPAPGAVIRPGGLARISISEGNAAASGFADPAVAGTAVPATGMATSTPVDASPADATPAGAVPVDATPAGATVSDATPPDPGPGDATPPGAAADGLPVDAPIGDSTHAEPAPGDGLPADALPANPPPTGLLDTAPIEAPPGSLITSTQAVQDPQADIPGTGLAPIDNASNVPPVSVAAVVASTAPVPVNSGGLTQEPSSLTTMPGWWWGVLLLALVLLAAGVTALVRMRQPTRQRAAWDARVYAKPQAPRQGDAHPVGDIPVAAPPFAIAVSLAFGDAVAAGDIPARMKEA